MKPDSEQLRMIAQRLRIDVVKMIACSGIGHVGGSTSIAEILAVLYFHEMRVEYGNPELPERDRFILSKGHGCPALYAIFPRLGYIPEDLLWTLHDIDSPLQMHPELGVCPGIEMSTGALGQGLSAAIGIALGARLAGKEFRVYVLIGDGESNEGQIWEAAMSAPQFHLDNLIAIVDYNKFSLSDRVERVMPLEPLADKWQAFGWHVLRVDGHDIEALLSVFAQAREIKGKPVVIIADTIKGNGVPQVADTAGSHSVVFSEGQAVETLRAMGCDEAEIGQFKLKLKEKE
jgi:transketolase